MEVQFSWSVRRRCLFAVSLIPPTVFLISPPSSAMSRKLSTFQQQTVSRCTRARTRPVPVMSGTGVCHALGTLQTLLLRAGRALFGIGEQFRFWGLASFSQAARLAYLQLSGPPGDVAMQNAAFPVVCGCMLPLEEPVCPIVPCAWAIEMPATSAATAVSVVRVFIICLLGS